MNAKLKTIVLAAVLAVSMAGPIYAAQQNKPVELAADTIEYDSVSGVMNAQGTVRLTQDGTVLTGTNAQYNTKTQEAYVTGGVTVVQDNATLTAAEVRSYNNSHIIAVGDVLLVKGDSTLTGPQIDYYADKAYAVVDHNAKLSMTDAVMTANKIEAYLNENRAVGTGNVHIVSDTRQLDATADQAVYYSGSNQQGQAVLTGNARAVQQGNVLTGNTLTIHLDDKTMDAQGRTKLVIKPQ